MIIFTFGYNKYKLVIVNLFRNKNHARNYYTVH